MEERSLTHEEPASGFQYLLPEENPVFETFQVRKHSFEKIKKIYPILCDIFGLENMSYSELRYKVDDHGRYVVALRKKIINGLPLQAAIEGSSLEKTEDNAKKLKEAVRGIYEKLKEKGVPLNGFDSKYVFVCHGEFLVNDWVLPYMITNLGTTQPRTQLGISAASVPPLLGPSMSDMDLTVNSFNALSINSEENGEPSTSATAPQEPVVSNTEEFSLGIALLAMLTGNFSSPKHYEIVKIPVSSSIMNDIGAMMNLKIQICESGPCYICREHLLYERKLTRFDGLEFLSILNTEVTCETKYVIYCLECRNCGIQYVGRTSRKLSERFGEHKYAIGDTKKPKAPKVYKHFDENNSCNGINNLTVRILEIIDFPDSNNNNIQETDSEEPKRRLKEREIYWINTLDTIKNGLNTRMG